MNKRWVIGKLSIRIDDGNMLSFWYHSKTGLKSLFFHKHNNYFSVSWNSDKYV